MRVLIVADPALPVPPRQYGGVERIVDGVVRCLRELGFEVGLVAHPESSAFADACFSFDGAQPSVPSQVHAVSAARRRFRPDLIHSFGRTLSLGPALLGRLPKIVSYNRSPTPRSVRLAAFVSRSLYFTGCSEFIADQGRSAAGIWAGIPNFVELDKLPFVDTVPGDAPLVFLSRIERIKGTREAIAIARAARRPLIIAGNIPSDAESQAYFAREVRPHLDGDSIRYIGPVDDAQKARLLGSAAALLVPIQWDEPFGIVFAEALACGTPVIACRRGALPEIVDHGTHGFLVSDLDEGVEAVARIGTLSRRACRERVEERFTRDHVVSKYVALYRQVVA